MNKAFNFSFYSFNYSGACIMEGEDESSGDDRAFNNKSVWARISVVFAGPFFNFMPAVSCFYRK